MAHRDGEKLEGVPGGVDPAQELRLFPLRGLPGNGDEAERAYRRQGVKSGGQGRGEQGRQRAGEGLKALSRWQCSRGVRRVTATSETGR